jgi:hypothetical protein
MFPERVSEPLFLASFSVETSSHVTRGMMRWGLTNISKRQNMRIGAALKETVADWHAQSRPQASLFFMACGDIKHHLCAALYDR